MGNAEMLVVYNGNFRAQQHLLRQVRRLCYGDALVSSGFRLEYRKPVHGSAHYLLIRHRKPVGVQYVKHRHWLEEVQQKLAIYLAVLGCNKQNTKFRTCGAHTALDFNPRNLPLLFQFDAWHNADEDDDFPAQEPLDLMPLFSNS